MMKFLKYLRYLLHSQQKNSKEKNLMDAPFWNGFYDRSKETKELFSKEKQRQSPLLFYLKLKALKFYNKNKLAGGNMYAKKL